MSSLGDLPNPRIELTSPASPASPALADTLKLQGNKRIRLEQKLSLELM